MKISEVIAELTRVKEQRGDLSVEVATENENDSAFSVYYKYPVVIIATYYQNDQE